MNPYTDDLDTSSFQQYLDLPIHAAVRSSNKSAQETAQRNNSIAIDAADSGGNTALMQSCSRACVDPSISGIQINANADVNAQNLRKQTAQHIAASAKRVNTVRLLLKKNATVNIRDYRGRTPLVIASEKGEVTIVQYLVLSGASVDVVAYDGSTAQSKAIGADWRAVVATQFNAGACDRHINIHAMNALSDKLQQPRVCNTLPGGGTDQLQQSLQKNDIPGIFASLHAGADVNTIFHAQYTPLQYSIQTRNAALLKALLQCRDVDLEIAVNDHTALSTACLQGDVEQVNMQQESHADVHRVDSQGNSMQLHALAGVNVSEALIALLIRYHVPLNLKNTSDSNAQITAVHLNKHDIVALLLQQPLIQLPKHTPQYSDDGNVSQWLQYMAVHRHDNHDQYRVCLRLVRYVALEDLTFCVTHGLLPFFFWFKSSLLFVLVGRFVTSTASNVTSSMNACIDVLKLQRINLDTTDDQGRTQLHYAIEHKHAPLVEKLLSVGVSIDAGPRTNTIRQQVYMLEKQGELSEFESTQVNVVKKNYSELTWHNINNISVPSTPHETATTTTTTASISNAGNDIHTSVQDPFQATTLLQCMLHGTMFDAPKGNLSHVSTENKDDDEKHTVQM